jgi:hypothetical protein
VAAPREVWVRQLSNFGNKKKKEEEEENNNNNSNNNLFRALTEKNIIRKYVVILTAQQTVCTKIQFVSHM